MSHLRTLILVHKVMAFVEQCHIYILAAIATVIAAPFLLLYWGFVYIYNKVKGNVYDNCLNEWVTKEKWEKEQYTKRIEKCEIPLVVENHVTTNKNARFLFFEKRKLVVPCDKLVYVEKEYCEEMHRFFSKNAEWLEAWQRWHGWDIVNYPSDDIKEGMLYPQDFSVFKHGFLWHSSLSSWDKDSDVFGNIHYYYEIDTDSQVPIKEQMDNMMTKIYEKVE